MRSGCFDAPLVRYTVMINGFDSMVVTKLDVLDHLGEPGIPKVLFRLCSANHTLRGSEAFYDAAPDGNRFLVSCMAPEARERSVNVVLDWQRLLNRLCAAHCEIRMYQCEMDSCYSR